MRIVSISDTHGQHNKLDLPDGDMIIHAGDISNIGRENEVLEFLSWFDNLNFKHKIFIAGNHDRCFENQPEQTRKLIPGSVHYLEDEVLEIDGLLIYGSPVTPAFNNWAFNRERGAEIRQVWKKIPSGIDILITHGPAMRILDQNAYGNFCGCLDLRERIFKVKPMVHICGHIHDGFGQLVQDGIQFRNVSVLNDHYKLVNSASTFDL